MSDKYVWVRVPTSTLDASDQENDFLQSPRGMLLEFSFAFPNKLKVAYNPDAPDAGVIGDRAIDVLRNIEDAASWEEFYRDLHEREGTKSSLEMLELYRKEKQDALEEWSNIRNGSEPAAE